MDRDELTMTKRHPDHRLVALGLSLLLIGLLAARTTVEDRLAGSVGVAAPPTPAAPTVTAVAARALAAREAAATAAAVADATVAPQATAYAQAIRGDHGSQTTPAPVVTPFPTGSPAPEQASR